MGSAVDQLSLMYTWSGLLIPPEVFTKVNLDMFMAAYHVFCHVVSFQGEMSMEKIELGQFLRIVSRISFMKDPHSGTVRPPPLCVDSLYCE